MAVKKVYDLMLNEDDDLKIAGGDLVVDESTAQHQTALVLDPKGSYKENPLATVGAGDYIDDKEKGELLQEIALRFASDGMTVERVTALPNGNVDVKAHY